MMYASSTVFSYSNEPFCLYSPLYFGFYRNSSSRSLFNLVKKGDVSMTTLTSHSPPATTITNNTERALDIYIPKGTILEGINIKMKPVVTTEDFRMKLPAKENVSIKLDCGTLTLPGNVVEQMMWTCSYCNVSCRYPNHICPCNGNCNHTPESRYTGNEYLLTSFIQPYKTPEPGKPKINTTSDLWNKELRDLKVESMCIASRLVKAMGHYWPGEDKYDAAVHEAIIFKMSNNKYILVEKMDGGDGIINTFPCEVNGNIVTTANDTLEIDPEEKWRMPLKTIYGKNVYDRLTNEVAYSTLYDNCQKFARMSFPEAKFSPPKYNGMKLFWRGLAEFNAHYNYPLGAIFPID